jgi:hypothetical protein
MKHNYLLLQKIREVQTTRTSAENCIVKILKIHMYDLICTRKNEQTKWLTEINRTNLAKFHSSFQATKKT